MKEDKKILDKVNRNSGMTVPENYFADFAEKMMQNAYIKNIVLTRILRDRSPVGSL